MGKRHKIGIQSDETIPLIQVLVVDECLPGKRFAAADTELSVATTDTEDLSGAEDGQVSAEASLRGGAVVTRDREFHYDSAKEATPPAVLFVVREEMSASDHDVRKILRGIESFYETNWTNGDDELTTYVELMNQSWTVRRAFSPPPLICTILAGLQTAGRVDTHDLGGMWGCSYSSASRRARALVEERWLGRHQEGRKVYYTAGELVVAYRNLKFSMSCT